MYNRAMEFDERDNPLATEIRQEKAEAYFAACKKMVASLEALKAFERAGGWRTKNEQLLRRTKLLEVAVERVHFVVIQREAMKLSGWERFFEDYEVPAEVRARMGAARQKFPHG
jgi:hypothetical protein